MNDFGVWLEKELNMRGWSMSELARRVDVSHAAISRIISGERNPSGQLCVNIAEALGVPQYEVLSRSGILPPLPEDRRYEETAMALFRELPDDSVRANIVAAMRGIIEAHRITVNAIDD